MGRSRTAVAMERTASIATMRAIRVGHRERDGAPGNRFRRLLRCQDGGTNVPIPLSWDVVSEKSKFPRSCSKDTEKRPCCRRSGKVLPPPRCTWYTPRQASTTSTLRSVDRLRQNSLATLELPARWGMHHPKESDAGFRNRDRIWGFDLPVGCRLRSDHP